MDIEIRDALAGDAEALSPLMGQLMHQPSTPAQIRLRLQRLAGTGADRRRPGPSGPVEPRDPIRDAFPPGADGRRRRVKEPRRYTALDAILNSVALTGNLAETAPAAAGRVGRSGGLPRAMRRAASGA
jgi:hypothetical protein